MANYDELISTIQYLLNSRFAPKPEFLHGLLGDGLGNVVVPNREDYVYVRFSRGANESFEAFNREAPAINDLPVLIGKKYEDLGLTQVVGIDWSSYIEAGWGDRYAGVALHSESHEWPDGSPGQDVMNVYARALVPLRAYVAGSGTSIVYCNSLEYEPSGTYWPGSPGVDLSAPRGAMITGTARYMGIYLDPGTNTLGVVTGATTVFSDAIPIPRPEFPLGVIPSARVRLYGGQASISDRDIVDARRLFTSLPTGTSDGFPVGPAGGDLTGSYPDPRVAGLFGYSLLDTTPSQGDRLYYTGGAWRPSPSPISFEGPAGGDLTGTYPDPLVAGLFGYSLLDTAPSEGDVLYFTGSAWQPVAFAGGGGGWPFLNIITVDSTDPDADYTTVTAAIAGASVGDTIHLNGEAFTEQVTLNVAGVTLVGAGFHNTKITNSSSPTILISATGTALVDLWAEHTGSGVGSNAIHLQGDCELRNVKATNNGATSGYAVLINNGPEVNIIQPDFEAVGGSAVGAYIQTALTDVTIEGGRIYGGAADLSIYAGATVDLKGPKLANVGILPQSGTLTGWHYDSGGDLIGAAFQEISPDNDGRGLFTRMVNVGGISGYVDHFRSGVIPTGFAWQGAPFVAPGLSSYNFANDYMKVRSTAGNRSFMSTAITNSAAAWQGKYIQGRVTVGATVNIGVRVDVGNDNEYGEVYVSGAPANGTIRVDFRYRIGGGAVTTVNTAAILPAGSFFVLRLLCYWTGAVYRFYCYMVSEDGTEQNLTSTGALTLVPAAGRVGIMVETFGNYGLCDWFWHNFG